MLQASGQIRESSVFGPNLVLRRRIMARVGESRIRIEDQIENEGFDPEPLMVLWFSPEELPEFVQWTMTGEGTYVLGLEPATCRVEGPAAEEAAGRVIHLQPGETRRHSLDLEVSQQAT